MKCETVKIEAKNEHGYIVINKSDLKDYNVIFQQAKKESKKVKNSNKKYK